MAHDRLSPLDSSFLHIEDDVSHMHIGAICTFEGPAPTYDELVARMAGKLDMVPRFRQVVRDVPADLGRPVWVDYPRFTLENHVRHTALPAPGDDAALERLVGRVMSQQLDRSKPLWEMWLTEGLGEGRWALISKTHHCMVDGVSGADMLEVILDADPDAPPQQPAPWSARPAPSPALLAAEALWQRATSPLEQARALRSATRAPRRALSEGAQVLRTLWSAAGVLGRPSPPTSLNGPIGPHRRWATAGATVAEVQEIRKALGGTFNDVVLAALGRGYRELLLARGEVPAEGIRTMVPVSVRGRNARGMAVGDGTFDNRISAVFVQLPVQLDDPLERLEAISLQMDGLKESHQAVAGERIVALTGFAPPALLALAGRVGTRVPQRTVNTLTTNVPGPQLPLYSCGRRMLDAHPYTPLGAQMRIATAIFSYDGKIGFGVTGDWDTTRDLGVLTWGIRAGVDELLDAAHGGPPGEVVDLRTARDARGVDAPV